MDLEKAFERAPLSLYKVRAVSTSKVVLVYGACWTPSGLPLVSGPVCGFHGEDLEVQSGGGGRLVLNLRVTALLSADDVVLLGSSGRDLQFTAECEAALPDLRPWFWVGMSLCLSISCCRGDGCPGFPPGPVGSETRPWTMSFCLMFLFCIHLYLLLQSAAAMLDFPPTLSQNSDFGCVSYVERGNSSLKRRIGSPAGVFRGVRLL